LAWNRIRREVEYRLNLAAAHWKLEKKNEILPRLQEKFEKSLNEGVILELEVTAMGAVDELMEEAVGEPRSV
jgi:hypothetical protein